MVRAAHVFPLRRGGTVYMKFMQGGTELVFRQQLQRQFRTVKFVKPRASRPESKELYLLCQGFRPAANANSSADARMNEQSQ